MMLPMQEAEPTKNKSTKRIRFEVDIGILKSRINGTESRAKSVTMWMASSAMFRLLMLMHTGGFGVLPYATRPYCERGGVQARMLTKSPPTMKLMRTPRKMVWMIIHLGELRLFRRLMKRRMDILIKPTAIKNSTSSIGES